MSVNELYYKAAIRLNTNGHADITYQCHCCLVRSYILQIIYEITSNKYFFLLVAQTAICMNRWPEIPKVNIYT